jgi:hypothetical protein
MRYRIDPEAGIVQILGETQPDELAVVLQAMGRDPAYRPTFGFLRDRRGMKRVSTKELLRAAAVIAQFPQLAGSRWAYIATDDADVDFILEAAEIARTQGLEFAIFPDPATARDWLSRGD